MSNETRWTPGPWFVSHANDDQAYEIGIQSDHGMKWHVCDICEGCDIDRKANAHLIAAAPDLYEALLEAEKDLVAAQVNARMAAVRDPRWEGVAEAIQPSIDKARAARAKARGEQS